jgi:hypothetical protein
MFTPWGSVLCFVGFLLRIWPNLMSGPGEFFFCNFYYYYYLFFYGKKKFDFFCFLLLDSKSARSARQKNTFSELVKSATNPPEIKNPPEIFFARQTTFKSARIVQIWQKKTCHLAALT